jgi:hypothetical protein
MTLTVDGILNELVKNISLDLLEQILDTYSIDFNWVYSKGKEEPFTELKWVCEGMFHNTSKYTTINLITMIKDDFYFYYFIVCETKELYQIIDKSIKLKSFL